MWIKVDGAVINLDNVCYFEKDFSMCEQREAIFYRLTDGDNYCQPFPSTKSRDDFYTDLMEYLGVSDPATCGSVRLNGRLVNND